MHVIKINIPSVGGEGGAYFQRGAYFGEGTVYTSFAILKYVYVKVLHQFQMLPRLDTGDKSSYHFNKLLAMLIVAVSC